jgi:conjugal transfer pilus assembly protein TraB
MKELYERIPAKYRRWLVVGAAVAVFSLVLTISGQITSGGDDPRRTNDEENQVQDILTGRDTGQARLERLVAQIENMRDENRDLSREVDRLTSAIDRQEERGVSGEVDARINELDQAIQALRDEGMIREDEQTGEVEVVLPGPSGQTPGPSDGGDVAGGASDAQTQPEVTFEPDPSLPEYQQRLDEMAQESDPMWSGGAESSSGGGSMSGGALQPESTGTPSDGEASTQGGSESAIRTIARGSGSQDGAQGTGGQSGGDGSADSEVDADKGVYIPAGSIVTGTLITGMDAPTGQQSRQDPHPALLRIKHEAILPNRFRADIRECFVLMGGYGSLSSERAYLRGETISCVREDGGVVESSLNSYTVGEDGKAGVRGRLVSKQGQFLARALMAGFLESFASAFDQAPVPSIDINEDGESGSSEQVYQQAFSEDALQSATVSGAGRAMDRLAEFYIDQAEGLFPVIEVDAGREVEIVLVNGTSLQIR